MVWPLKKKKGRGDVSWRSRPKRKSSHGSTSGAKEVEMRMPTSTPPLQPAIRHIMDTTSGSAYYDKGESEILFYDPKGACV